MERPIKIIAVVGPTASGKSSLGIYLARKLGGEIISADSRQVYRGLNLGTGKVTKKEMAGVPHHLLDVISPKKQFSVSGFATLGTQACLDISKRHKVPMVVGGTGLYVDTLLGRMSFAEVPPNPKLRAKLESKSTETLFAMLQKKDPDRAVTIDSKNKRRLIRALEICEGQSKKKEYPSLSVPSSSSSTRIRRSEELFFTKRDVLWLGINPSEAVLKKNIHIRLLARLRAGMVAEAKRLHTQGLTYRRMRELGLEYRFLADYLSGICSKEEMVEGLERAINHYAKRQWRWFKRNKEIHWVSSKAEAWRLAKEFLR